ncbi:hypothetical protein KP79_PYT17270 [Mizuhopecten yessoensis]|uniref:Uncharacterized protein n=1 Tax=Mizuhopecten yessoensis TaxID=6573 RepID=A0A210PPC1_MIZYE|nr:hypothetical protein KP79_PYT17270 [Mizuhopecten yessoensis]
MIRLSITLSERNIHIQFENSPCTIPSLIFIPNLPPSSASSSHTSNDHVVKQWLRKDSGLRLYLLISMTFYPPLLLVLLLTLRQTTEAITVIRSWVPARQIEVCVKEALLVPELYIEQVGGFFLLRRCTSGTLFSIPACGCVETFPVPEVLTTTHRTTTTAVTSTGIQGVPVPSQDDGQFGDFCGPSFRFIYNRTTMSDDRSVPSLATNSVRFVRLAGSVGETSLLLGRDGFLTIWTMSYITFAHRFKFMLRFKLHENFEYQDQLYNLFGDGPCGNYTSKYRISVNPVKREVHADVTLRNRAMVNLVLSDVRLDDWTVVELEAMRGQVRLVIDHRERRDYIGASTIKSSPCPMEIGKESSTAAGFVGYIDMLAFHNCFGN